MKHTLLLIVACALFLASPAQQRRLLLHSGAMNTTENVDRFISEDQPASELFNGYYYRILQFNAIPTAEEKAAIANSGLILMEYMPENAFVTAIPSGFDKSRLKSLNVFAVIRQDAIQKIQKNLLGTAPDYARKISGYTDVIVQYYQNIPHATAVAASSYYEKLSENRTIHSITLRVAENEIQQLASLPWVFYLSPAGVPSLPEDARGQSLHRSNSINSDYASGRHYDGTGVVIGLADDGEVGPHIDFTGRLTNHLVGAGGTHGDMTSGICVGAGNLDPTKKGMATGAYLHVYDINGYPHLNNAVANYDSLGTVILSTSYSQGCNEYTVETQLADQLIHTNTQLEFVFSAGNNGQGICNANPYGAGAGWGTITGGYKQGKNTIAVGDLTAFDVIQATSSRGPASDGRIKPDICANGEGQISTLPNNAYQPNGNGNGTSAACPGIAGVTAQLYQAYKSLNGGLNPESGLIKACLLNSAEDLGNEGPDYVYGWGRVNALRALTTLEEGRYIKDSVVQGQSNTHTLTVPPGVSEIRVMIYWMDPEGTPGASKSLVNDLDMHLTDPINFSWLPWVLDPTPNATNLATPAVKGIDTLNNMEQVSVPAGFQGTWTIHVDGTSIPMGPQTYYIVYEFRTQAITVTYPQGGEGFVPGETQVIRWDAVKGLGTYTLEYSTDNGANWNLIDNAVNQNLLYYNWAVPSTITGEALIRLTRGTDVGISDSLFSIIDVPQNIQVDYACVDSIRLTWDPVTGAAGYNIYKLGATTMDWVGTSATNDFTVTGTNPNIDYWFSVDAITSIGTKGRRAIAVQKLAGTINCPLAYDAGITSILSPSAGTLSDCQGIDTIYVSVLINNGGVNDISNFTVSYALNNGTIYTDTITDTVTVGANLVHTFSVPVDYSTLGNYSLAAWIGLTGDLNIYNDTAVSVTDVISGQLFSLPYSDDFQTYGLCSTASDCEATVCPLGNGWINDTNGAVDDIDFRVNAGGTPTNNTGPNADHTTGTPVGQYVYLEASACFGKRAQLLTPCIDLTTNTGPQLSFWYHMNGFLMGELHVDVLANGIWVDDVMTPVVGNQGNTWIRSDVNLAAFAGEIITIRFRAVTGTGSSSDLALDDISIIETNVPPVPAFTADYTTTCLGNTVTLTDKSTFNPTSWQWTITPNTFTYVNSTSATSQNPQVQFNSTGTYDIQLTASNAFGTDSTFQTSYISIVTPTAIALTEDFQGTWLPYAWRVETSGNNHTWEQATNITGSDGNPTSAALMYNFDYAPFGGVEGLTKIQVDLGAALLPKMTFDLSYARANNFNSDQLRIDISNDCGNTFVPSGYQKQGAQLATVPNTNTPFAPQAANQWRNDTVDLSAWVGQVISIRFTNTSNSGNNLYIDNINIADFTGINAPSLNAIVSIYPNPSTDGIFNLTLNGLKGENADLTITDVQGKLVEQRSEWIHSGYVGTIDLSSKDKGVYFLEIKTATGVSRYKLSVM